MVEDERVRELELQIAQEQNLRKKDELASQLLRLKIESHRRPRVKIVGSKDKLHLHVPKDVGEPKLPYKDSD